eukprot:956664_1
MEKIDLMEIMNKIHEGEMWHHPHDPNDDIHINEFIPMESSQILKLHDIKPLELQPKEGLALINGTQFITSLGCEALIRSERLARQTDVVAALSLEVLKGTSRAYYPSIHLARPHDGQLFSASILRNNKNNNNNTKMKMKVKVKVMQHLKLQQQYYDFSMCFDGTYAYGGSGYIKE